ncbi:MAG: AtzH-like domain-containing protein [Candidatus Rokuibacteriota bacterium]
MSDLTPDIPEVVAEVRALFERYEQALVDKNVAVLDTTFWNSPHTIRYALHENGHDLIGRQSQTWVRFPDLGWKVITAHVSTMNAVPLW